MNWLFNAFPREITVTAGWTLLHSLWEGALVSVILYLLIYLLRKRSANVKALISTAALALFVVMTLATYIIIKDFRGGQENYSPVYNGYNYTNPETYPADNGNTAAGGDNLFSEYYRGAKDYINNNINYIFSLWVIGLSFFFIRFAGGLFFMERIKKGAAVIEERKWNVCLDNLCDRLSLKRKIKLGESGSVSVPVVMGFFKPVILFPFEILSGLPQEQIEAIIAHEVAHIKRYDLFINLFQSAVEVIFFFNPFARWISGRIRLEREYCCDDIAISQCGDELIYAKALANLESLIDSNMPLFAVPLFKNKNQLLRRITRMLHQDKNRNNFKEKFTAAIIFMALVVSAALFKNTNAQPPAQNEQAGVFSIAAGEFIPADLQAVTDTVKKHRNTLNLSFDGKEDGVTNSYKVKIREDEIVSLSVNGRKIPKEEYGKYKEMIAKKVVEHKAAMKQHEIEMKKHEEDMKQHELNMKQHEQDMKQHEVDMKQHEADMKKYEQDMKQYEEDMKQHNADMKKHEADMKKHREDMKIHEAEMKKHNAFMKGMKELLIKEKVMSENDKLSFSFDSSRLIVNDKEVSKEVFIKAKKLYKESFNKEIGDNASFNVNVKK